MVYRGTSVRGRSAAVQGLVKVAVNETGGSELENHQGIGRSSPRFISQPIPCGINGIAVYRDTAVAA